MLHLKTTTWYKLTTPNLNFYIIFFIIMQSFNTCFLNLHLLKHPCGPKLACITYFLSKWNKNTKHLYIPRNSQRHIK
jgi:hypothetical protein